MTGGHLLYLNPQSIPGLYGDVHTDHREDLAQGIVPGRVNPVQVCVEIGVRSYYIPLDLVPMFDWVKTPGGAIVLLSRPYTPENIRKKSDYTRRVNDAAYQGSTLA